MISNIGLLAAGASGSGLLTVAYLGAAVLFILSLGGLSTQESAKRGNLYGIIGMVVALAATMLHPNISSYTISANGALAGAIGIGCVIGAVMAKRVEMTAMPELVALLHSFVGLAAVLVGFSSHLTPLHAMSGAEHTIHSIEVFIDVAIGAITFTGSIVAWLKLRGKFMKWWIPGKPLLLPGRHFLNLGALVSIIVMGALFASLTNFTDVQFGLTSFQWLLVMSVVAGLLGVHLVAAIGGADMPVVVSLLNSYSGWTASAAGFMLGNNLLIVTGALVGSSGAILSYIMCKAMNRSIANVVFGGFGATSSSSGSEVEPEGEIRTIDADDLADEIKDAKDIIIVPGYGMARAQAQGAVNSFTRKMTSRGARVRFAIHPVAGRLPGHMNVLLAEAGVSYKLVLEMDEINEDFPETDVVLVIGANDIVNPLAQTDPNCDIAGMPVLEVWKAKRTVVFKRSVGGKGYAGVQNPLFYKDNNRMYLGSAQDTMEKLNAEIG